MASYSLSCPANNDIFRLPDLITPNAVKCHVCGLGDVGDRDGREGKIWLSVRFGPLQNSDGAIHEADVAGYFVMFLDSKGRFILFNDRDGLVNGTNMPTIGKLAGGVVSCCAKDHYSAVIEGDLPTDAKRIMVTAYDSSGNWLPIGLKQKVEDTIGGQRTLSKFTVAFKMSSVAGIAAFESLLAKSIPSAISGTTVTASMVSIHDIQFTYTVVNNVNTPTVRVKFVVLHSVGVTITLNLGPLKTYLIANANAYSVPIPGISGTPTQIGNTLVEDIGTPTASKAPQTRLALIPLILALLSFSK